MVKLVFCLRRRPELTRDEFQRYWLDRHGPLVRSHAETLSIRRYVQVHTLDSPANDGLAGPRGAPEPFDGVAELWFDSLDDLRAAGASPAGRAAGRELLEDERTFIDFERSPIWVAEEHEVVGAGAR
jgi:uncharacterized protein (TIGR02118 family)